MHLRARLGLSATVLSLLAACGGGSSGSAGSTPPPAPPKPTAPTTDDLANASAAQLKITLRDDTNYLTVSWTDTFSSESGYRVEARTPDSGWQTIASTPAANATGGPFQIGRTVEGPSTYRVSAVMSGYTVPLQTAAGQSEIAVDTQGTGFIPMGPNEPKQGTQSPGFNYNYGSSYTPQQVQEVTYYLGSDALGSSTTYPVFRVNWDTTTVPDGSYELRGVARLVSGAFIEVRRAVVVDNPDDLAASLHITRVAGSLTDFDLTARATSSAGISTVDFFVDNTLVHTEPGVGGADDTYTFVTSNLADGTHTVRVVATDNANETAEATRELVIDNPPVVTLAAPLRDRIVTNSLHIEGTFADEQPGATLTVTLGDVTILQSSTTGAFSVDHALTGVAPGDYTLAVRAVDSQGHHTLDTRDLTVVSSQTDVEQIATDVQKILDIEQGAVLYKKTDGTVILRDSSGAEVTLQMPAEPTDFDVFDLSEGHVAAQLEVANSRQVYVFAPNGQATSISQPIGTDYNENPQLSYPWLIWDAGLDNHLEIYNLATQTRTTVQPGHTIGEHAFIATEGAEKIVYSAHVSGIGSGASYDIFLYDLASGVTQRATGSARDLAPQADNDRFAWQGASYGNYYGPFILSAAPIANPTATTMHSTAMSVFTLRDGQLAWTEPNSDGTSELRVDDASVTTEITPAASGTFFVADGLITFQQNGQLHTWQSATGSQVLLPSLPAQKLQHDDGIGFFTKGSTPAQTLYRIELP